MPAASLVAIGLLIKICDQKILSARYYLLYNIIGIYYDILAKLTIFPEFRFNSD